MGPLELETALGVPGAATSWGAFGPLMTKYRLGVYPTMACGAGNGTAKRHPGWLASDIPGKPIFDDDPLIAGCKCLLLALKAHEFIDGEWRMK